jgi:purine-nucleoside phosphorylase
MLQRMGAHMVGMSTALEAIAARASGLEVLGLSLITNLAAGIQDSPLNHAEVLDAGRAAEGRLGALLAQILQQVVTSHPA